MYTHTPVQNILGWLQNVCGTVSYSSYGDLYKYSTADDYNYEHWYNYNKFTNVRYVS